MFRWVSQRSLSSLQLLSPAEHCSYTVEVLGDKACSQDQSSCRAERLLTCDLTSVLKVPAETIVTRFFLQVSPTLVLPQSAYRPNRSVEDAVMTVLHTTYGHLEKPQTYTRILLVDFSSAFNCMQPHILCTKLQELQVDPLMILWILDFLLHREQLVRVNSSSSSVMMIYI